MTMRFSGQTFVSMRRREADRARMKAFREKAASLRMHFKGSLTQPTGTAGMFAAARRPASVKKFSGSPNGSQLAV